MPTEKYKNKYRIPSARATWHDYNGGIYFITICTKYREHDFGEIENEMMQLSDIGIHTQKCIEEITQHNPYAEIPSYVIMPNHLHLIVIIDYNKTPHEKRAIDTITTPVETFQETSRNNKTSQEMSQETFQETFQETSLQKKTPIERATEMQSWLSVVIRQFKQSITRFANANNIEFTWQTRFHDHIIRNNDEMASIAEYIENNVAKWEEDNFYTPCRPM